MPNFAKMTSVAANGFASSSSAVMASGRSYTDAIECLNSLQSNAATVAAVRAQGRSLDSYQIPDFIDYVKRIGYEASRVSVASFFRF